MAQPGGPSTSTAPARMEQTDQRRIPERPGQPLAEWARRRSLAEVDYEPGDSGLRPPPPEQVREQRDGHETDHQVIGDERRTAAVHVGEAGYCT